MRQLWGDKPYYSLDYYLRERFGEKVYKLSLDAHLTCPNRDGTKGSRGCIFCSEGGSGDFAPGHLDSITAQLDEAKKYIAKKYHADKYIAYFQAFTNTYAPVTHLKSLYMEAVNYPSVAAISIATRPDCLGPDVLKLLDEINHIKPVIVELGLQTIHEKSAEYIRRGYDLNVYDKAVEELNKLTIPVVTHLILGLPHETPDDMLKSVKYLNSHPVSGVKLQLLHVMEGTDLATDYRKGYFEALTMDEYVDILIDCIGHLSQDVVVHRITGDAPKKLLIAPEWSREKWKVLNTINAEFERRGVFQGKYL